MIQSIILYLILIVIIGTGIIIFKNLKKELIKIREESSLSYLKQDIEAVRKEVGEGIWKTTEMTQRQLGQSVGVIKEITEKLTKLDETNRQVLDFSQQLQNLQDILKNPKQRGILGEYFLETLLKNAFQPKQYQMQYYFKDGTAVDAVLFFGDKIIPIDSKFSLENYNQIIKEKNLKEREVLEKKFIQDLKNQINQTAKYIRPQEGTTEFAFMFIPAEGIYHDLLVNEIGSIKINTRDLLNYAIHEKNVHIVSPTTFYVTLQSFLQGMRDYQIQEKTKEIIKNVSMLSRHLKAYEQYMERLGSQLGTTVNSYNQASRELGKINKDILKLTGESPELEILKLEKPEE